MASEISVLLKVKLVNPIKNSLATLQSFAALWHCHILDAGTNNPVAVMSMPKRIYNTIFGTNPVVGPVNVPTNSEFFISALEVTSIKGT